LWTLPLVVRIIGMDIGVLLLTGKTQWGADGDPRELVAFAVRAQLEQVAALIPSLRQADVRPSPSDANP
jgi:hypothetical protein